MRHSVNKADLVMLISMQTGYDKQTIQNILEAGFHHIRKQMAIGDNVYLRGFGSFIIKERKEKIGRNLRNNTSLLVPSRRVPYFKPSRTFIDMMK